MVHSQAKVVCAKGLASQSITGGINLTLLLVIVQQAHDYLLSIYSQESMFYLVYCSMCQVTKEM